MNCIHIIDPKKIVSRCLKADEAGSLELPEIQSPMLFIAGHVDQKLTVRHVADEQGISRRTLELRFRTHLRCTVGNMLTRLRVATACRLLEETKLSASDISVDVGFASASSMANDIRRHLGLTATKIRVEHRSRDLREQGQNLCNASLDAMTHCGNQNSLKSSRNLRALRFE